MNIQIRLILIFIFFLIPPSYSISSAFSWKCLGCEAGVEVLRFLFEKNETLSEIIKTADYICRHFADQDSFVCRGIISQFQDEFIYVLSRLIFWPTQLCGLLIRNCGTHIDPFDTNWTVPLPPKPFVRNQQPRKNIENAVAPLRILQLSDIHFDPNYLVGSEAGCNEPVCCLQKSDKPKQKAGYWGAIAKCDIPLRTFQNLLEHINQTHQLDFVFLSGDYVDHRDWGMFPTFQCKFPFFQVYTKNGHKLAISSITDLLQQYLPSVPIYWTLGNHEGVPVNAFAPHFVLAKFRPQWIFRAILDAGHKTAKLPNSVNESAIFRGSYAVELDAGLKLISLNNGYCDKTNLFIYINQTDPDGSLTWLVDELWAAEKANQAVYILAHIPPGDDECLESWSRNYYRIVVRFAKSIRGQFFGHTHYDSFSLFYAKMNDPKSEPVSMLFTAPSVTTFVGVNPSYRIYNVDPSTWQLLDYETYFLNLTATTNTPNWKFLYSAKSEYGLANMEVGEWSNLVGRIEREPEMARKFNRNYMRRDGIPCDSECLAKRICSIKAAHHNEKALCGKIRRRKKHIRNKGEHKINILE